MHAKLHAQNSFQREGLLAFSETLGLGFQRASVRGTIDAPGGAKPMRNRSSRRHNQSLTGLRLAIDCMPIATREAMLAGVRDSERIISGAYVDVHGGVCPMLAAHRRGGRTDFLSFARSWDRFTHAAGRARVVSNRQRAILVSQLEDSLEQAGGLELDRAISEHRQLRRQRLRRARLTLKALDPRGEIRARRFRAPSRRAASPSR
jgi:hypothetical protein